MPSIAAAAGVNQIEAALNQVHIRQGLLSKLYCDTIFGEIATTSWFDGLTCGTQVTIIHEPDFKFRPLEKDQELEIETPKVCTTTFGAHYAAYAYVKFDDMDKQYLCNYNLIRPAFEDVIRRKAREQIEATIFSHIYAEAHSMNRGLTAGSSGMYNLGDIGQPYPATSETISDLMLFMGGVLDDQCVEDMNRWVVFPKELKILFSQGTLAKTILNGGCTVCTDASNGKLYADLAGFDIYFSPRLPKCVDPVTNQTTWIVPFGHKEGMGYTMDMSPFETIRLERAFGDGVRVQLVYGAGTGRPEYLGYAYITVDMGPNVA